VPPGRYQLRVSYIGYENYQQEVVITAGNTITLRIEMVALAANLNEIVVTGTMKEETKLESVTPVDVYTAKYFERNPTTNLWDALSNVNGIFPDVDNGVTNTTDIQINGIEGNYTMIMIDGVPVMNGLAGVYALNALPVAMIDKVEILKGASSTLYGSEAIAGVINIITKNPSTTPRLVVNTSLTSMLEASADITASFRLKKASSLLMMSGQSSNYRWDVNGDGFMDIPLTNQANFYNKWNFDRRDSGITTIYGRFLFDDRFGGQINTPGRLVDNDSFYTEWIRTYQWEVGLQYQLPVKDKVMLMGDYSEDYQSAYYGLNYFVGRQRTIFSQLTWTKKLDRVNDLLLGASYRMNYYTDNTGLSNDSLTGVGKVSQIAGVFMEDELSLGAYNKLVLGARFDYTSSNGPVVTPRANYKWNSKDKNNVVRLGIGTGYRVPNVLYDGFGALNGSRTIYVAEKLKPEQALTTNLDYTRVQQLSGGLLNIDASLFYTYFFNFIDPDYSQSPTLIVYANNTNGAMAPGGSVWADFTFNYPLKVGAGFTVVDVFEIDVDSLGHRSREQTVHSPPFTSNFYFSYSFPVPQLSLDWTGIIMSPMLLSTVPNDFRPGHSPWYTIQNIQVTKKFKNGLQIYAGIKNIFNFIQPNPILRPFDPFNRSVNIDNPNGYRFDTTYGWTNTEGIKAFAGLRYTLP